MASNSRPRFSTSSSVRWAIGLVALFCTVVMVLSSKDGVELNVVEAVQTSISQEPRRSDAGLHQHAGVGCADGYGAVRTSRTAPLRRGTTQPKHTPIRQPDGMSTPAFSPASRSVVSEPVSTSSRPG
jgi:hypothetical protein